MVGQKIIQLRTLWNYAALLGITRENFQKWDFLGKN